MNAAHVQTLKLGTKSWNKWRAEHDTIRPDLNGANLSTLNLSGVDLSDAGLDDVNLLNVNLTDADLSSSSLSGARLRGIKLRGANLTGAELRSADMRGAQLSGASLRRAHLRGADLSKADLSEADLRGADLSAANFSAANLNGANVSYALTNRTVFDDLDLREVQGLESIEHLGPSAISINTVYRSQGEIPAAFLQGCGVPEDFISYMRSLTAKAIEFYSCFISYSGHDEQFARRLHSRMRQAALRVWFAPEDMKGGDKLYDQIDRAIQVHDRLLLVLSKSSLRSKWVELEIRRARKVEMREGRRKLFPIRLVSYEALQDWTCIDSTTGEDLAEEVRGYFIPDFSNWKSHDDFERAFARLLSDLKASA